MNMEDVVRVECLDDGSLDVEFSEGFLSSSREEQIQALEAFFWRKTLELSATPEVNKAMTEHEITIIVAETVLAKLKRGEPIERDTTIEISLEELMTLESEAGPAGVTDIARVLKEAADGEEGDD